MCRETVCISAIQSFKLTRNYQNNNQDNNEMLGSLVLDALPDTECVVLGENGEVVSIFRIYDQCTVTVR